MITIEDKKAVEQAISCFKTWAFQAACVDFWKVLGYKSERSFDQVSYNAQTFKQEFSTVHTINEAKALTADWLNCLVLFQLTDKEIKDSLKETIQEDLFDNFTQKVDNTQIHSYLFMAIELGNKEYTRTMLATITREINRCFAMPVLLLFKYDNKLTLSVIDRRENKRDASKDVLEKVTLIKDISMDNTHRAHVEILCELSFNHLYDTYKFDCFVKLHKAWKKTLDIRTLNNKFFVQIRNWYLWSLKHVRFPQSRPESELESDRDHQSKSVIRFMTRFMFCWFLKEKQEIIPYAFFNQSRLNKLLRDFDTSGNDSNYYKAILQNLFFATLSVPQGERDYIGKDEYPGKNLDYGNTQKFRYQDSFIDYDGAIKQFKAIPFLNGGLFDCLDKKKDKDNPIEVRLDGFSKVASKQAVFPNFLFWGKHTVDLSEALDAAKFKTTEVMGLIELFEQYIFTVEESTPIEEEIALDPELLGRVFENILAYTNPETHKTVRKGTASFYTPRKIVDYMVDLSLKEYLSKALKNNLSMTDADVATGLEILFTYTEKDHAFNKQELICLIQAIESCKVIDPACGSGAFLMGMLHKMSYVLSKIDPGNNIWFELLIDRLPSHLQEQMRQSLGKENVTYNRKLGLIQQCIYGIDIQPIAVQIAKLRFFLTLIIEQDIDPKADNYGIVPLPNLEFKLVCADTIAKLTDYAVTDDSDYDNFLTKPYLSELETSIRHYFSTSKPEAKQHTKQRILAIIKAFVKPQLVEISKQEEKLNYYTGKAKPKTQETIANLHYKAQQWESYLNIFADKEAQFFDTQLFFPEVDKGFDIVIGNPPYIQLQNEILRQKTGLYEKMGYKVFSRMGDIYGLFYERGMDLLNNKGLLCYITSNKWMRAPYGDSLRKYFNSFNPLVLINIGPNVFENATVDTNIILIEKADNKQTLLTTDLNKADETDLDFAIQIITSLKQQNQQDEGLWFIGDNTMQGLVEKTATIGKPIKDFWVSIFRGVLTGLNEAFIISTETQNMLCAEDPKSIEIIKPLLKGRDIQRYTAVYDGTCLLATGYDTDIINNYPAVYHHLLHFREKAEKRDDQGMKWFNLRSCSYYDEFAKEKLVWKRIGSLLRFAYDASGMYALDSTCIMTGEMLYEICAILNSKLGNWILLENAPKTGTGDIIASVQAIEPIRMPEITNDNAALYNQLKALTKGIIDTQKTGLPDTSVMDNEINQIVYKLYGLTSEEIKFIEKADLV
jgi:hypothetical protein